MLFLSMDGYITLWLFNIAMEAMALIEIDGLTY